MIGDMVKCYHLVKGEPVWVWVQSRSEPTTPAVDLMRTALHVCDQISIECNRQCAESLAEKVHIAQAIEAPANCIVDIDQSITEHGPGVVEHRIWVTLIRNTESVELIINWINHTEDLDEIPMWEAHWYTYGTIEIGIEWDYSPLSVKHTLPQDSDDPNYPTVVEALT